jgi:hypothetical protein
MKTGVKPRFPTPTGAMGLPGDKNDFARPCTRFALATANGVRLSTGGFTP